MNSVGWLMLIASIGGSLAGLLPVNPGGIGGIFSGPNSETIIRGPDGSEITSEQIGGTVETGPRLDPIVVPDYQDDQIAVSSVTVSPTETISISNNVDGSSPTLIGVIPETSGVNLQINPIPAASITQTIPIQVSAQVAPVSALPTLVSTAAEPHIIETELVDAPDVEPNQSSILEGPSGSISVRGSSSIISGPASTTISEPVRRIPISTVPIAAQLPVPSAILIPPAPPVNIANIDHVPPNVASDIQSTITLNTNLVPPASPKYRLQSPSYVSLNTELVPPPPPSIALTQSGSSGVSGVDRSQVYPQTQYISSTPIPSESLPPNAIDLGQTIVSTTQRSLVAPSTGDVDISRINLGQSNIQQAIELSSAQSHSVSSTVSPIEGQNVVSSTPTTILSPPVQTSLISQQNEEVSLPSDRRLYTTSLDVQDSDIQSNISPSSTLDSHNIIDTSNGLTGNIFSQDQSILTNQIITNTARPTFNVLNSVGPTRAPSVNVPNNIPSRSWLNVDPDHIISKASTALNGGPISSILDTVLVQPTDPKNREIIEFDGKQLENVGNIVPVLHQPLLVAGGLTHIQNIPTASVSQLASRHDFNTDEYNRYDRQILNRN